MNLLINENINEFLICHKECKVLLILIERAFFPVQL